MNSAKATLKDGHTVDFIPDMIGEGGMKQVFFTADKSSVICFFKDQGAGADPQRLARLEAVLGKFNPTTDSKTGNYWKNLFCWPTGIVMQPFFGVMAPAYPKNFFFAAGPFQGKEKEGTWFSRPKLRGMLPESERGTWINYFQVCILMARAVRRLHQAGLAHSDLSCRNVLVDPSQGKSVVIDIDSLVVPQLFPPDVLGTPGYIAPEVLGTLHLPLQDPNRQHPSARTDQHALAVLIYEYMLFRHPLRGPKVNSTVSAEEDERLSMGSKAIFVEHPADQSNRPADLKVPFNTLGPYLSDLFQRAFVKGLHAPNDRPAAIEWERGLIKSWDLLIPCSNASCSHKWFVFHDASQARCPFCGTKLKGAIPLLKLRKESRPGQWMQDGQLVIWDGVSLFKWHVYDNVFPGEEADRTPQAYCRFHQGKWLLINQNLASLTSPGGNRVAPGKAVELADGAQIRLAQEPHARIASVQVIPV